MSSLLATLRRPRGGRALVVTLVLALAAATVTGPAAGDEIDDARSDAEQIADRIEELEHEAEVLTERYLDAQLARTTLEDEIAGARQRAERSGAELERSRSDLRALAVEGYVRGGADGSSPAILGASDATDITLRRGYARSLAADEDDLLDAYRGQQRRADRDARTLDALLDEARATEDEIEASRAETEERIAELQQLQDEVTGRLRQLVEAEQRRRAEAERRRAAEAEAAARAAAEAPADVDEEPAAPDDAPDDDRAPDTTTTTTTPPSAPPPAPTEPAPTPPAPAPAPPASGAAGAVAAAHSVIGTPYKWAGASPEEGFDCSGLIMWAYAQVGRSLPHSSRALYSMSRRIAVEELQPGDLVFYNSPVSHVGLYIGGGNMIHAPHTGSTVQIESIYYWSALSGAGRL
jgi:cell wall-associated NlpC family hydrolase